MPVINKIRARAQRARTSDNVRVAVPLLLLACACGQPLFAQQPAQAQPTPVKSTAGQTSPSTQTGDAASSRTEAEGEAQPESNADAQPAQEAQDRAQADFQRMDRDGDGRITSTEHAADAREQFDAMDADNNYNVSTAEHDTMRGGGKSVGEQLAAEDAPIPGDGNSDGEISISEHENQTEAQFRGQDANQDGSIDRDEMNKAMAPRDAFTAPDAQPDAPQP